MQHGLTVSSHFMNSEREAVTGRVVANEDDEGEEFYDFLPFQKEFLIPLRDRAFSWDVSFEDEIHGDNEAQAISVISEQQDSHRLVIKAKASTMKRLAEAKDAPVEAPEPAPKKGKATANSKKKDGSAVTSPTPQPNKSNLKAAAASSSSGSSNGKPPTKACATTAASAASAAKNVPAGVPSAKAAAAARKIFNVASSPSTELLDTQTLRNTLSNAQSTAESEFHHIKSEFDVLGSNSLPFGFGNEFEIGTGSRRNSVAFDDALSLHFKTDDDFTDLADETFGDDFRPPRKLSWSIDFNAIEAAMGGSLMNPIAEGPYQSGNEHNMSYQSAYAYENNNGDQSGVFPSLLRQSEATGSTGGPYHDPTQMAQGSNMNHAQGLNKNLHHNNVGHSGSHGTAPYLHHAGATDHSSSSSGAPHATSSNMMSSNMSNKNDSRDQLANMMSGAMNPHNHHNMSSSGMSMSGTSLYNSSLNQGHSGMMSSSNGMLNPDGSLMNTASMGGLTLGGLTVPNDGEFRVGAYTKLERHMKIEAFREKKRTRIWRKQIKYDCRKRLADTRPRVKGRFVSRKGDKGGGDGDDMDGPDGPDGPDAVSGPSNGPHNPLPSQNLNQQRPMLHGHMMHHNQLPHPQQGNNNMAPMGNQLLHQQHHQVGGLMNTNMHHSGPGHNNKLNMNAVNSGSYLSSGNVGDHSHLSSIHPNSNMNSMNTHMNSHSMHSNTLGNSVGSHSNVGVSGMGSTNMMGIKTEMKYAGSAHSQSHMPLQHSHLQQPLQQSHLHTNTTHSLPSIPSMNNAYHHAGMNSTNTLNNTLNNNSAVSGGPHLSSVRPGMVGTLNTNSSSSGPGAIHSHGPPHNLLSQAQQQKLQQQQVLAQNALQQHHLQQQQHLLQQQQQQLHGPPMGQQTQGPPLHNLHAQQQQQQPMSSHQPLQQQQQQQQRLPLQQQQHQPLHQTPMQQNSLHSNVSGTVGSVGTGALNTSMSASPAPPLQGLKNPTTSNVPTGLLLSGPSAAHLHSTSAGGAPHPSALPLPSVASHTAVSGGISVPPMSLSPVPSIASTPTPPTFNNAPR